MGRGLSTQIPVDALEFTSVIVHPSRQNRLAKMKMQIIVKVALKNKDQMRPLKTKKLSDHLSASPNSETEMEKYGDA